MKKGTVFTKVTSVLAVVLFFGGTIVSCGGGGGDAPPLTEIKSISDAENASSEANQAAKLAAGTGETFINLGMFELFYPAPQFKAPRSMDLTGGTAITAKLSEKFAKSPAVASATAKVKKAAGSRTIVTISDSGTCDKDGSWSYLGTADDVAGTFDLTMTFTACREFDSKIDGTYTISGTVTATSVTTAIALNGFSIIDYVPGSDYGSIVSTMSADISFTGLMSANATSLIFRMTGNGTMDATEGTITYNATFANYSIADTYTPGASFDTHSINTNGSVGEGWTTTAGTFSASISYENFVVGIKKYLNLDEEITIDGVFTIDFAPDQCFEGRYSIQTTTPIYWDALDVRTEAGRLVINGNTAIIFNADGTITVEYEGTPIPGMVDVYELTLNGVCLIGSL
ncbi:MAG TPA: hypothetical protein DCO77_14130 [Nitrospiraceae bacterium]|nr:hypothetical protein [Nitrospiraceae bacterium]